MSPKRVSSYHEVHFSVQHLGTNHREGGWQDKSRKVRGGRMAQKTNDNNLLTQGAPTAATLLHPTIHWEPCEPDKVRVSAP
jgi:hypothetical protein